MPEYRLYCLNEHGGFSRSHEIPAGDDADAIARAKAMKLPVKCEAVGARPVSGAAAGSRRPVRQVL
jgi:hypothetical protein